MPKMFTLGALLAGICLASAVTSSAARNTQQPVMPVVDFAREVQPILRERCYGCHGESQQMNGLRLDRRRDAMRGGTITVITPGAGDASRLYLRLVGHKFGTQMPPGAPLPAEEIAIIKAWIDQGALWPDAASGEASITVADPAVTRLVQMLRDGNVRAFRTGMANRPRLVHAKGHGGATPLMYAALYGDFAAVQDLLTHGADVNARNDAGVTALMWAAGDPDKVRALLDAGADVNARSDAGRTPLLIAAGIRGSAPALKLLLAKGAKVNVTSPSLFGQFTPLAEASMIGDVESFRLLVAAGADLKAAGPAALGLGFRAGCMECAETLIKAFPPELMTGTMIGGAPPTGLALGTPMFLKMGADIKARDESGRSILMLAAASPAMPVDVVKALLAMNMDVHERTAQGETALGLARRHGHATPVVQLLEAAGAKADPLPRAPTPAPAHTVRAAVERALPLLQQGDVGFLKKAGCVSCHNNSLTSMTLQAARGKGFRFDAAVAADQTRKVAEYLEGWRERSLQGVGIPGDADTVSYILLGLAAEGYPGDLATDAQARFLKRVQAPDGHWTLLANRPPIESSDIQVTATTMRALQVYAPKAQRAEYDQSIAAAAAWLRAAQPVMTEERAFHLYGLHWSKARKAQITQAGRDLIAEQRPDGGWAQIATLDSDAYATGQALSALAQSGAIAVSDPAYRRGVEFLRKTQLADGSWLVRTRAIPIQPLFDAGFPHGADSFISAAATNWAATALALAQ